MTIPERIMEEARAIFNERDVLGSIARAIQAAEQRGAASSQQATVTVTDEQAVDLWLNQPEGFSLRIERLGDDIVNDPGRMRNWLIAAYRLGREAAASPSPAPSRLVEGPQPCGIADPSTRDCPNMKEVGGGMDGERYRCAVCGNGYFLDYEEMK